MPEWKRDCDELITWHHRWLVFCAFPGNRWAGPVAPHPAHRSRVYGLETRPCHQTLPSHREDQVCFLRAICQLRRTTKVSCIFEAQIQQILRPFYRGSWDSPGAVTLRASAPLLCTFREGGSTRRKKKLHRSGSPASDHGGISSDCNFF